MAITYPTTLDALTNPVSTDLTNSVTVPHATQHADLNDAVEAIEAELGTLPKGSSATVKARLELADLRNTGYTTVATAAGTTTLTASSTHTQFMTGTTTQTVVLPVTSTLVLGDKFRVVNNSTGVVTVQSSGLNTIYAQVAKTEAEYTVILTSGTDDASWSAEYSGVKVVTGTGSLVLATSPTMVTPTLGVAAATTVNKVTITAPATGATLTLVEGGSLITAGAYAVTLTSTATTGVTLPTTGTLATLAGSETLSNKTLTTPAIGAATATSIVSSGPISGGLRGNLGAAPTVASATTIAPTTAVFLVSGTTTIETITAPAPIATLGGTVTIIPTGVFVTGVTGNIALASTSVVSKALHMTYDPTTVKWYPSY